MLTIRVTCGRWLLSSEGLRSIGNTQSELIRTFFTNSDQFAFARLPLDAENQGKGFDFAYEFVSAKKLAKDPSTILFEAMIKVNRSPFFEVHNKVYPKLMYFHYLLKADARLLYLKVFGKTPRIDVYTSQSDGVNKGTTAPVFNDRRDRMTPSQISVL